MKRVELPEEWRKRAIVIGDAIFSSDWFTNSELAIADSFRLRKRQTEWKHGRVAAKQLALDLGVCPAARNCIVERPRLIVRGTVSDHFVSIAHSGGYAAAAIDVVPVGIDVEKLRVVKEDAAHLFLTDAETDQMRAASIDYRMLHFWAAKEAAWKRRGGSTETLKRVPLTLEAETATGLRFDQVETFASGEVVVALTRPTSGEVSSRR